MENTKNIEAQSALTPPLKAVVVNGKKKIVENGVVELNIPTPTPQKQSDWNQNDENAPDFIKNRICYEYPQSVTDETMLIESTGIAGSVNGFYYFNPVVPFKSNGVYYGSVGTYTFQLSGGGMPDNSVGSGGGGCAIGGVTYAWDVDGLSDAPNGETAKVQWGGTPESFGEVLYFFEMVIVTVPQKFLPFDIQNGEGKNSVIIGTTSYPNKALGEASLAQGHNVLAYGLASHAEGAGWTEAVDLTYVSPQTFTCYGNFDRYMNSKVLYNDKYYAVEDAVYDSYTQTTTLKFDTSMTASGNISIQFLSGAFGFGSHAEGGGSVASAQYAHASGPSTAAIDYGQFVFGYNNIVDAPHPWESGKSYVISDYVEYFGGRYICIQSNSDTNWTASHWKLLNLPRLLEIVGNGGNFEKHLQCSNARTLDYQGNESLAGTLRIGSTGTAGVILKEDSGSLKISFDNGTTWKTVSAS